MVAAAERDILNSERDVEGELLEQLQELHRQLAEVRALPYVRACSANTCAVVCLHICALLQLLS